MMLLPCAEIPKSVPASLTMLVLHPYTAVCDNAPTTDIVLSANSACAVGTGSCATGQADASTVTYECSAGYSGTPAVITCDGGATNAWTGTAPTCSGMKLYSA